MKRLTLALLLLAGCASTNPGGWKIENIDQVKSSDVTFHRGQSAGIAITLPTKPLQALLESKRAMAALTGVHAELLLMDSDEANAFSATKDGKPVIGFYAGMMKLLGDDKDAAAAIMGHEFAHLVLGHAETAAKRESARAAVSTVAGFLLDLAKVPGGSSIADISTTAVSTVFSRDEEREADRYGMDYMRRTGYDPKGAVRAWEKMAAVSGFNIPFLSSHPTSAERLETMKRLAQ